MHFFDAAHLLAGTLPGTVQAMSASRPDGTVDLVSATTRHPGGLLAGFTHGFTHAHRCERQQMRLDHGTAEVRVDGWIPVCAVVDAWTDDAGAEVAEALPQRAADALLRRRLPARRRTPRSRSRSGATPARPRRPAAASGTSYPTTSEPS